ncbi:MAG: hypothetical protein R6W72_14660 [Desulfurivibrionaceae bacterium]
MAGSARKSIFPKALLATATLVCLLISPAWVRGSDQPESEESRDEDKSLMSYIDRYHAYLNSQVNQPAIWFDGFFGDPRAYEEELPTSFVRVRISARYTEGDSFDFPVRLRANIKLPKASDKLSLIILGYDPEDDETTRFDDDLPRTIDEERDKERSSVGLRYIIYKSIRSKLHFGGGTSSLIPFEYYLRASYRRFVHIASNNVIKFSQIGYWDSEDGFGTTSRVDFERALPQKITGRLSLFGTHSEISRGVDWGVETNLFRPLSPKSAISLDLGTYGITKPDFKTTYYRIGVRTRANVLRPWLFLEINPALTFPLDQEDERQAVGVMTVMMEIQFSADH